MTLDELIERLQCLKTDGQPGTTLVSVFIQGDGINADVVDVDARHDDEGSYVDVLAAR